jgi:hypothetical protein
MTSRKRTARLAGALYAVMGLLGAISLTYFPSRFLVPHDPAATGARIESAKLLYRFCVLIDLTAAFAAIWLAVTLYQLFQDVDRRQAQLLVLTLFVQVPMLFAIMLIQLAPLVLLNGASYWSAFDKPQLEALAHGFLNLREQGIGAISAYWGLWLLPLGVLVYKSVFIPRIIGVFLIIAGCTYVVSALTFFLLPAYYRTVFWGAAPLYGLGEASFIGYTLIKGVRAERLQAA